MRRKLCTPIGTELSYPGDMAELDKAELEKGPRGLRRGRGARRAHPRRVTKAVPRARHQLHRHRPALRRGAGVQAHDVPALRRQGRVDRRVPAPLRSQGHARGVRPHRPHAPRRLLAAFDINSPLCPFIAAAVEIQEPDHTARAIARDYKKAIAARFAETAREAGATNPEQLGEQLALLLDGASARNRVLDNGSFATAAATAIVLIDDSTPAAA